MYLRLISDATLQSLNSMTKLLHAWSVPRIKDRNKIEIAIFSLFDDHFSPSRCGAWADAVNDYLQQLSTLTLSNNKLRRISLIEKKSAANDAVLSRRATLSAVSCSIFLPSRRDCADKAGVHVRSQSACASRTQSTNLWSRILCKTCEFTKNT
jgi:hypothetical protein